MFDLRQVMIQNVTKKKLTEIKRKDNSCKATKTKTEKRNCCLIKVVD